MDTKTRKCVQSSHFFHEIKSAAVRKINLQMPLKSRPRRNNITADLLPKRVKGCKLPFIPQFFHKRQLNFLIIKLSFKTKQMDFDPPLGITIAYCGANPNVQYAAVG